MQLEGQVVALLVQNMERLDEQVKEEADGIYNTLGKKTSSTVNKQLLSSYNVATNVEITAILNSLSPESNYFSSRTSETIKKASENI